MALKKLKQEMEKRREHALEDEKERTKGPKMKKEREESLQEILNETVALRSNQYKKVSNTIDSVFQSPDMNIMYFSIRNA